MTTPQDPIADLATDWMPKAVADLLDPTVPSLQRFCTLKRISERLKQIEDAMRPAANAGFTDMLKDPANQNLSKWKVGDFALLTAATPPGTWVLSPELVALGADYDKQVAAFKAANKDTAFKPASPDPKRHMLFRVTVTV